MSDRRADANNGSNSSFDQDLDDAQLEGQQADQQGNADSPSAEQHDEPAKDVLSIVRDVVDKNPRQAPDSSPGDQSDGKAGGGQNKDDANGRKEPDNEAYSDVPFHKHPRFTQLLDERNTLRERAGGADQILGFISQNGLTQDQAAGAILIAGLVETNPEEAWKRLMPLVTRVMTDTGRLLPDDLRQRVELGHVTPEIASEMARQRAQNAIAQRATQRQTAQQQTDSDTQALMALQATANAWEERQARIDPSYAGMASAVQQEVRYLLTTAEKPVKTPADAVRLFETAYKTVKAEKAPKTQQAPTQQRQVPAAGGAAQQRPAAQAPSQQQQRRPAMQPVTGGRVAAGGQGGQAQKGASTLDIIRSVTAQRRGG